jgi:uncharacterized protein
MIASAEPFFARMAAENHFAVDFTDDAGTINAENLGSYQVFVMLHLAPFEMTSPQQEALQNFIESGNGWVGIHAAGLAGKQFVGSNKTYWQWFEEFLGGVTLRLTPSSETHINEKHRRQTALQTHWAAGSPAPCAAVFGYRPLQ